MICNKVANKVTKVSKHSQENKPETDTNVRDKERPKERCISSEKDRKLLMTWDYFNSIIMEYQKIVNLLDNTPN